jgi:hypothetical protein
MPSKGRFKINFLEFMKITCILVLIVLSNDRFLAVLSGYGAKFNNSIS